MRTARLLLPLLLGAACGAPVIDALEPPAPPSAPAPLLDDMLLRVAERVPGFGGLFVDDEGRLTAYLRPPEVGPAAVAEEALAAAVAAVFGRGRVAAGLRVVPGRFTLRELLAWRARLEAQVLADPDVVLVDLDEARNDLRLGLRPGSAPRALRTLDPAPLPAEAVRIEEVPALAPLLGLRDRHRPTLGGVQIASVRGLCTLGFNARREDTAGFVTNSHCTSRRGVRDGTVFYQPDDEGDRVGVELLDPGARAAAPCPAGRRCRYSDSVFVRYDTGRGAPPGQLALAAAGDPEAALRGTLRVVGLLGPALPGERAAKVGRTTGRTTGTVVATCATINVAGTQQTLLCQTLVAAAVGPGDSGSPVYREAGGGGAHLLGLLWGGSGAHFVFSPLGQVLREDELGPLQVCAPGAGC